MKTTLLSLPILQDPSMAAPVQDLKVPDFYQTFVTKNLQKLETRFKVLGYPLEQIKDAYLSLVKEPTQEDFDQILSIRGVKKQDIGAQYKLVLLPQ